MNNSNKKHYLFWLVKAALFAVGSLLPVNLIANNLASLSDSADSHSTTVATRQEISVRYAFRFPASNSEAVGLTAQFFNALSLELAENRSWLQVGDSEAGLYPDRLSQPDWVYQQILFNGEKKLAITVMREQALKAFSRAATDTFNATPWGRKIKAVEQKLAGYFVIALSKNQFDHRPVLHLPGEARLADEKQEKEYEVSLSSSFYADLDSFKGDYELKLNAAYHDYQFQAEYDVGRDKLVLRLENRLLNTLLGVQAALSLVKNTGRPLSGLLNFSWIL